MFSPVCLGRFKHSCQFGVFVLGCFCGYAKFNLPLFWFAWLQWATWYFRMIRYCVPEYFLIALFCRIRVELLLGRFYSSYLLASGKFGVQPC